MEEFILLLTQKYGFFESVSYLKMYGNGDYCSVEEEGKKIIISALFGSARFSIIVTKKEEIEKVKNIIDELAILSIGEKVFL